MIKVDAPVAAATQPSTPSSSTPPASIQPPSKEDPSASSAPAPRPAFGRLRRPGSISIKDAIPDTPQAALKPQEVVGPPLDIERLQSLWNEMVEAMGKSDKREYQKLALQLKDRQLEIEAEDQFVIIVSNSFLESEIKNFLIQILSFLRSKSQRPQLNSRIKVVYEEKKSVAYSPRDKYDVMQKHNPAIDTFRILFPEVDY